MTNRVSTAAARRQAAERARQWASRAVLGIVQESGGQVVHRPLFSDRPDLDLKVAGAEPVAGLRAAAALNQAARRLSLDYARYAREDGHSWQDIGIALGFSDDPESHMTVAATAYDYAAGTSAWRSFGWVCRQCRATVIDRGPEAGHPSDCEEGHTDGCTRLAAAVAAWAASWDDEADL